MVLTPQQSVEALHHIVREVLVTIPIPAGQPNRIEQALTESGIDNIYDFMSMDKTMIDTLSYTEQGQEVELHLARRKVIEVFFDFVRWRASSGNSVSDAWLTITRNEFNAFRISPEYLEMRARSNYGASIQGQPPQPPQFSSASSTRPSTYTLAEAWRKGIKRDPTLFPVLKDERLNDTWHRSFTNQARAQGLMNVLDPGYKPQSQDERDVFAHQQAWMYAVLDSTVKTDRGKAIVRKYEATYDAQRAYKELREHHLTSTKALIDSSTILEYITSARLGTGQWKGTTEGFITHWQNQVRLYERQVPPSDHFSDGQKKVMLENTVAPISELRQVKVTADLERAKGGTALTYDQYSALLLAAATAYDEQTNKRSKSLRRTVFMHEMDPLDEDYAGYAPTDDEDAYDIDCPVSVIHANAAERMRRPMSTPRKSFGPGPRTRMTRDQWRSLSEKTRAIWDTIPEAEKAIILGTQRSTPRQAQQHEFVGSTDTPPDDDHGEPPPDDEHFEDALQDDTDPTVLVNALKTGSLHPGDITRVLSSSSKRHPSAGDPKTVRHVNQVVTYTVSKQARHATRSLIDRGANGGCAGKDMRVIDRRFRTVSVQGAMDHQVNDIPVGTTGGVIDTDKGPVIGICHQYALTDTGHTIHSCVQLEDNGLDVNDRSVHVSGGLQRIRTPDGHTIPLSFENGLPRMNIRPFTDAEWDTLPHVVLTRDNEWDPTVFDHQVDDPEEWFDAVSTLEEDPGTSLFDEFGNCRHRVVVNRAEHFYDPMDSIIDHCVRHTYHTQYDAHEHSMHLRSHPLYDEDSAPVEPAPYSKRTPTTVTSQEPDFTALRPFFAWLSPERIKHTFNLTTQMARIPHGTLLKRTYKSPNPALNVPRRSEPVACDIVCSDTPAIDDGSTAAVIFYGTNTHVTDVYGIKTDKQFINTLEDNIRERGAPTRLLSDRAQVEISRKVMDILRTLFIGSWQSEPHQQQQNPAERRYQTIKDATNRLMDRTGALASTWLLAMQHMCFLLNRMYDSVIKNVPLTALLGVTIDISVLLRFFFWQEVYYKLSEAEFPSKSKEGKGRIVGISEHVGHALTYKILTDDTQKIIYRSLVRPVSPDDVNLRPSTEPGEDSSPPPNFIKSRFDSVNASGTDPESTIDHAIPPEPEPPPVFNPEDLIGRTFLMDPKSDGQQFRARIVDLLEDHESKLEDNPTRIRFLVKYDKDQVEEVFTYNKVLDHILKDEESDIVWKYKRIVSHQGPLTKEHPDCNGSSCNIMVEWENGEITSEPLKVLAADDPVSCAIYAREHGLLDTPGWKQFKSIAKRQKKFTRMINQAKLRSFNNAPRFKYGFEVPRDYRHAMRLDEANGNDRWAKAVDLEFSQVDEYETFEDRGHKDIVKAPDGYRKIRVHLVFDVKHDGRFKARLVADGHLTDAPLESVYSGVVSIRGLRIVAFLAELNNLEMWATDVGNAYLEACTNEKVCIVAGPEFGSRKDHILVIRKALYGLKTSGARWHDRFADCLRDLGFQPCKAEPDIWLRRNGEHCECIAVCVDDLAFVLKDPKEFIRVLEQDYKFKLKGSGIIDFHLGMNFVRDQHGVLCIKSEKYHKKMMDAYTRMFGGPPKQNVQSPIEKGDHPELDTSELLEPDDVSKYQSLIGSLQWAITIGRFDIATAVMTLSSFRAAPRKGHMERVKRIFGYLAKMDRACLRIRTEEPDYSDLHIPEYDWSTSVYGNPKEEIPKDAPEPLGAWVTLTHFVDANLMHDLVSGKSVTGILHLLNKFPVDWHSKKQATVETATYGSEFVAARTCVEQIMDLRLTLRHLGVPIREKSHMFGDNKSVVDSANTVHAKLHKRHTMLSFHRVREAMASNMLAFSHINGDINPADILSKHWGHSAVWPQLRALLHRDGDTMRND